MIYVGIKPCCGCIVAAIADYPDMAAIIGGTLQNWRSRNLDIQYVDGPVRLNACRCEPAIPKVTPKQEVLSL